MLQMIRFSKHWNVPVWGRPLLPTLFFHRNSYSIKFANLLQPNSACLLHFQHVQHRNPLRLASSTDISVEQHKSHSRKSSKIVKNNIRKWRVFSRTKFWEISWDDRPKLNSISRSISQIFRKIFENYLAEMFIQNWPHLLPDSWKLNFCQKSNQFWRSSSLFYFQDIVCSAVRL